MASAPSYHHGDLPNALRSAAAEVIDERGLGAFSLREVARRAGVSHTAPAHHFGDSRGLLTAIATDGFRELHRTTTAAAAGIADPTERLIAIAGAYVRLAGTHHAHCEVMFRADVVDPDDEQLSEAGMLAYSVLECTVRDLIDDDRLTVDLDEATWLCWSTMQGLVQLTPKIDEISTVKHDRPAVVTHLVERFTRLIVAGLRNPDASA